MIDKPFILFYIHDLDFVNRVTHLMHSKYSRRIIININTDIAINVNLTIILITLFQSQKVMKNKYRASDFIIVRYLFL